jgi:inosose dehydratase
VIFSSVAIPVGNSPVSWGVHYAEDARNEPWQEVVDGIARAGYDRLELGTLGYLPEDGAAVRSFLAERGLEPVAMYIFQPAHTDRGAQRDVLDRARRTARLLAEVGARHLVIIDERNPARIPTAGRSADAARLDDAGFERLVADIEDVASVALAEGIQAVLHPHVAGFIEFEDEIARALDALDPAVVALCLDTGHCAYAGIDPAAAIRRWADRLAYLHFKDVDGAVHERTLREHVDFDTAMRAGVFCPLGQGIVDFRAVAAALAATGYGGTATVEQDHEPSDPDKSRKALAGAVESLRFLRAAGIAR